MVLTNEQRIMLMEVLKLWLRKSNEKEEDFIFGDLKDVQVQSQWVNILKIGDIHNKISVRKGWKRRRFSFGQQRYVGFLLFDDSSNCVRREQRRKPYRLQEERQTLNKYENH